MGRAAARIVLSLGLLVSLTAAAPAFAKKATKKGRAAPDSRTVGLGRSCQKRADCKSKAQTCLKGMDQSGKEEAHGFCALPCLALDAGTTKVIPGQGIAPDENTKNDIKKKAPPRCPPKYQCRSAGAGVPIDLCIKE
ncbi:MAG: hypothetical protein JST92_23205 [Deltaproteobacteria bacterium]|nr:hypothetical protein [Deltaproteobacteria bacterium]